VPKQIKKKLYQHKNPEKAKVLQRFFKTGKGEYGEGDKFLGIVVPTLRKIAKEFQDASQNDLTQLIQSRWHEERLLSLFILILQYQQSQNKTERKNIYRFYLKQMKFINNWDLVDLSAHKIPGNYLLVQNNCAILYRWAKSKTLWTRRIAILSTLAFIRENKFNHTLKLAKLLLNDDHDLIHKAVGWMLREIGKRDLEIEEKFLKKYYRRMPRTMLRYAIERFPERKRKAYLKGTV